MRKLVFIAAFVLAGCTTLAPNFSTESCLSKAEYAETLQTAAVETLADIRQSLTIEQLKTGKNYLEASDDIIESATAMCDTDSRTAIKLLGEAQALLAKFNKVGG